jgi:hypothetical protein
MRVGQGTDAGEVADADLGVVEHPAQVVQRALGRFSALRVLGLLLGDERVLRLEGLRPDPEAGSYPLRLLVVADGERLRDGGVAGVQRRMVLALGAADPDVGVELADVLPLADAHLELRLPRLL